MEKGKLQEAVERIVAAHGHERNFWRGSEFHLRLKMQGFEDLIIERQSMMGWQRVTVQHYRLVDEYHDEWDFSVDVEFRAPIDGRPWYEISMEHRPYGSYETLRDGGVRFSRAARAFSNMWGRNLLAQGWATPGATATSATHEPEGVAA